jgi:hypothetical protein
MDIKKLRLSKKNEIYNNIKSAEKTILLNKNSINSLSKNMTEFNSNKIKSIKQKNVELSSKIDLLNEDINKLNRGDFDEELSNEIKKNLEESKNKELSSQKKKKILQDDKDEMKSQLQKHYDVENKINRSSRWLEKDMQKAYDIFCKNNASIPDYILNNLEKMPSNKGYIWKNIWCFGRLPEEKNKPVVMFDNKGGGVTMIHECFSDFIYVYQKSGNKKELVKTIPRTIRNEPRSFGLSETRI